MTQPSSSRARLLTGGMVLATVAPCCDPVHQNPGATASPSASTAAMVGASTRRSAESAPAEPQHRLRRRFIETSDGMRIPGGLWDTKLDIPCAFELGGDNLLRCFPETGSQYGQPKFSDPLCTQPILWVCSPRSESIVRWVPDQQGLERKRATPDQMRYSRLGPQVRGLERVYSSYSGKCRGDPWSDTASPCRLHEVGQPIDVDALVVAKYVE